MSGSQFDDTGQALNAQQAEASQTEASELSGLPMTVRQVADYLGIGEDVARSLFRTGKLRAFKAGGQWRVYPSHLTEYILKQLQKT